MKSQPQQLSEQEMNENTVELDLKQLQKLEQGPKIGTDGGSEVIESVELDEPEWFFESTVTNLQMFESTITNLDVAKIESLEEDEPAWRVLEKRREERELKAILEDEFSYLEN